MITERRMDACSDARVIMPNHVQGILVLVEAGSKPASTVMVRQGLPEIVWALVRKWNRPVASNAESIITAKAGIQRRLGWEM